MRAIAVLNQKGGVGKTTTVANVAAALAMNGQRVLVMDLDPQSHLTIHLGADRQVGGGTYDVLVRNVPLEQAVREVRPNLWLLGANIDLVGAESELVSVVGREIILREALEAVRDRYDYLLVDCPPSLGLLSLNALAAVREVFIPLLPHFLALQGLGKLLETITLVNRRVNPHLKITAILLCMYDKRTTLSSEVRNDIEGFLREARGTQVPWAEAQIIPACVRRNIKLAEAPSYGKTIFEYEPDCNGATDYLAIARHVHTGMGTEGVWTLDRRDETPAGAVADSEDEMTPETSPASDQVAAIQLLAPGHEAQAEGRAPVSADGAARPESPTATPTPKTYTEVTTPIASATEPSKTETTTGDSSVSEESSTASGSPQTVAEQSPEESCANDTTESAPSETPLGEQPQRPKIEIVELAPSAQAPSPSQQTLP